MPKDRDRGSRTRNPAVRTQDCPLQKATAQHCEVKYCTFRSIPGPPRRWNIRTTWRRLFCYCCCAYPALDLQHLSWFLPAAAQYTRCWFAWSPVYAFPSCHLRHQFHTSACAPQLRTAPNGTERHRTAQKGSPRSAPPASSTQSSGNYKIYAKSGRTFESHFPFQMLICILFS